MNLQLDWVLPALSALAMVAVHSLWIATLAALLYAGGQRLRLWRTPQAGYLVGLGLLLLVVLALVWVGAGEFAQLGRDTAEPLVQAALDLSADTVAATSSELPAVAALRTPALQWTLALAGLAWLLGMCWSAWRTWRSWRLLRRVVRLAQASPTLEARARLLAERLGLSAAVRVVCSALDHAPFVLGLLKPVIVLPASTLTGLTPAQLDAVLMHELAHVRRVDLWVNLLQVLLETVLFFHPAVHWLSNRVRELREECCDDLVVAGGVDRPLYARALLMLEQRRLLASQLAPAASGGVLLQRIDRIVAGAAGSDEAERAPASAPLLAVLLAAVVLALGLQWPRGLSEAQVMAGARRVLDPSHGVPLAPVPEPVLRGLHAPLALDIPTQAAEPPLWPAPTLRPGNGRAIPRATLRHPVDLQVQAPALNIETPAATGEAQPRDPEGFVPLSRALPVFPDGALRAGSSGRVRLSYGLDGSGWPRSVRVDFANGDVAFVSAARAALRQWRYSTEDAARLGTDRLSQDFNFRLSGAGADVDAEGRCDLTTGTRVCRR